MPVHSTAAPVRRRGLLSVLAIAALVAGLVAGGTAPMASAEQTGVELPVIDIALTDPDPSHNSIGYLHGREEQGRCDDIGRRPCRSALGGCDGGRDQGARESHVDLAEAALSDQVLV